MVADVVPERMAASSLATHRGGRHCSLWGQLQLTRLPSFLPAPQVYLVDQCPTCPGRDLDFSNPAFRELTGLSPDRVKIEWCTWAGGGGLVCGAGWLGVKQVFKSTQQPKWVVKSMQQPRVLSRMPCTGSHAATAPAGISLRAPTASPAASG